MSPPAIAMWSIPIPWSGRGYDTEDQFLFVRWVSSGGGKVVRSRRVGKRPAEARFLA